MSDLLPLAIRCRSVSKRFGDAVALTGFNLDVWEGTIVALLGPSGCGKTTALRAIAGFERPDGGSIEINDTLVFSSSVDVPPERRRVGMVFQDYALFPHFTVSDNVAYGLASPDRARVAEVIEMVGLAGLESRMPHALSGGQQQRVALARALAPKPAVLLMDEPFSNLDASLRERVRSEVRSILRESKTTGVFVTHDQEEALSMADVVAVMEGGRILQAAPPDDLYLRPNSRAVAAFLGDANFLSGTAGNGVVHTALGTFPTQLDGPVEVMIRPESIDLRADATAGNRVVDRQFFGHDQVITVRLVDGNEIRVRTGPMSIPDAASVSLSAESAQVFRS